MSKVDSLNWELYPSFEGIQTDSGFTILVGLNTEPTEKMSSLFQKCKNEFPNSEIEESNYFSKIIIKNSTVIVIATTCYNCIAVRFYENSENLKNIIKSMFYDESIFFIDIDHGERNIDFQKSNFTTKSKTGYCEYEGENQLLTFLKFYHHDSHIADMLIGYSASEMGECTATILVFEVFPEFRGKGIGKKIISEIEYVTYNEGFLKLRLDNTQSMPFWEKLEYDIDIDEGEKDLTYLMFNDIVIWISHIKYSLKFYELIVNS